MSSTPLRKLDRPSNGMGLDEDGQSSRFHLISIVSYLQQLRARSNQPWGEPDAI